MKKEVILRVIPFPFDGQPTGLLPCLVVDEEVKEGDYALRHYSETNTYWIFQMDDEDRHDQYTQKVLVHPTQISLDILHMIAKGELTDGMKVHIEIDISGANGEPANAPIKYDKDGKVFITKIPTAEEAAAALVDAEQ